MNARIFGIIGLLPLLVLPPLWFLTLLNAPWFSWCGNAISDMGKYPRASAIYLNLSMILEGALYFIFSSFLYFHFKEDMMKAGAGLMSTYSFFMILIGVFTENYRPLHLIISITFFIIVTFSFLPFLIYYFSRKEYSNHKIASFYSLISFLVLSLLWVIPWETICGGIAIPEFTLGMVIIGWMSLHSIKLLRGDID